MHILNSYFVSSVAKIFNGSHKTNKLINRICHKKMAYKNSLKTKFFPVSFTCKFDFH